MLEIWNFEAGTRNESGKSMDITITGDWEHKKRPWYEV
jgi:hypothetical protein